MPASHVRDSSHRMPIINVILVQNIQGSHRRGWFKGIPSSAGMTACRRLQRLGLADSIQVENLGLSGSVHLVRPLFQRPAGQ